MHQLGLARLFAAYPRLHATGLEVAHARAGADLAVGVLARHPDFQIVGFGAAKTHVAGAEHNDAVGQLQQLQDLFGVAGQLLQRLEALVGGDDLHHLHLVELMLANKASGVFAAGSGFGAEARGMGDKLERQLGFVEDAVAHQVGHRHFGGGDQRERLRTLI